MHANRNKNAIKRVKKGMMKANRIRNLFAVFAIVLTTFMITSIFSIAINYMENMNLMYVRTAGTSAHISLNMPTTQQEEQIEALDYVEVIGRQYMVGSIDEKTLEGNELLVVLRYYDETEWEQHYRKVISEVNGNYPKKENEIMLSEDILFQLGITKPTLHMEIPLSYYDKNGYQEKTFILSGWFHSYTVEGMAFVSESYCRNAGYNMQDDGVLSLSLKKLPDDFLRIENEITLTENQHMMGTAALNSADPIVIIVAVLFVLMIVVSGYLLIYNILYISISKDTRFYGLLKTLGTTQKQIRSLVKSQALKLSWIGIPIGILLATIVSFMLVPAVLQWTLEQGQGAMDVEMFFHPIIYILSICFSVITVWIASNAPAKAAAKTSPVEALKFQNFAPKKTKSRNSKNGSKLHIMAFHNVFRDKKRAILVFVSLFMGITMILGVNEFLMSIQIENYIKSYMDYDFEYTDTQFTQHEQTEKELPQFDEHFVEELLQIDAIEKLDVRKTVWASIDFDETALEDFLRAKYENSSFRKDGKSFEQMLSVLNRYSEDGDYGCYITTLDDDKALEEYNTNHPDTPIDIEAFKRGETAIVGTDNGKFAPNAELVGKTLTLTADSADGKATDFCIGGSFDDYGSSFSREIGQRKKIESVPDVIYVSEAGMEHLTNKSIISFIGVELKDLDQLYETDHKLQKLNQTLPGTEWDYNNAIDEMEYLNQSFYSVNLLGNAISIMLIVIGLVNFVNVMITGVINRKNEFAIMESIGTTKKQIRNMLILEGGIYALITTLLIMTFGNIFILFVAKTVPYVIDYAKFVYPIGLLIALITVIFIICLTVPAIAYKTISKETVIERLHNFDN